MRLVWVIIPLVLIGIVGVQESFSTEPRMPQYWLENPEIIISNLPKLGETADVTVIFNHTHLWKDKESADGPLHELEIAISGDTLEFVDSSYDTKEDKYNFGRLIVYEMMEYNESEKTMQVTIKSIAEGEARIGVRVTDAQAVISFYTESEQAMLLNDYYEMYPEYLIEKIKTEEMERERQRKAGLIPEPEPTVIIYPSPLKQIKLGITPEEIQCKEKHVLVVRNNGKIACVTEATSKRLGWIILNESTKQQVDYEFPLSTKDYQTKEANNSAPRLWGEDPEIIISNLSKLGETAEVTAIFTSIGMDSNPYETKLGITKHFEIIDSPYEITENELAYFIVQPFSDGEEIRKTNSIKVTIKAISEGKSSIGAYIEDARTYLDLYVESDQTMLLED